MIDPHPVACQIPDAIYIVLNHFASLMKLILSAPKEAIRLFIIPVVGDNSIVTILTSTTVEMKWGMYVTVCINFFIFIFLISFIIKASMIGDGKPQSKE